MVSSSVKSLVNLMKWNCELVKLIIVRWMPGLKIHYVGNQKVTNQFPCKKKMKYTLKYKKFVATDWKPTDKPMRLLGAVVTLLMVWNDDETSLRRKCIWAGLETAQVSSLQWVFLVTPNPVPEWEMTLQTCCFFIFSRFRINSINSRTRSKSCLICCQYLNCSFNSFDWLHSSIVWLKIKKNIAGFEIRKKNHWWRYIWE